MSSSCFLVASSILWFLHKTLPKVIFSLFYLVYQRSLLAFLRTSGLCGLRSALGSVHGMGRARISSALICGTHYCTKYSLGLRASLYATFLIRSMISKGPINLGISFPFFLNLITPLRGAIFRKMTCSTWNSRGLSSFVSITLLSTMCIFLASVIPFVKSVWLRLVCLASYQWIGDQHFLTLKASYGAMIVKAW